MPITVPLELFSSMLFLLSWIFVGASLTLLIVMLKVEIGGSLVLNFCT